MRISRNKSKGVKFAWNGKGGALVIALVTPAAVAALAATLVAASPAPLNSAKPASTSRPAIIRQAWKKSVRSMESWPPASV